MNATHVVVGHERMSGVGGRIVLDTVAFGVASSADAVANLADQTLYTPTAQTVSPSPSGRILTPAYPN